MEKTEIVIAPCERCRYYVFDGRHCRFEQVFSATRPDVITGKTTHSVYPKHKAREARGQEGHCGPDGQNFQHDLLTRWFWRWVGKWTLIYSLALSVIGCEILVAYHERPNKSSQVTEGGS